MSKAHSHMHSHTACYLGIAAKEAVGDGDIEVEVEPLQDVSFHGDKLRALVGVVTNVQEVIDTWRASLLRETDSERKRDWNIFSTLQQVFAVSLLTISQETSKQHKNGKRKHKQLTK